MNLARAHFLKHSAKVEAMRAAEYGEMQQATTYELMLKQLANDKHRLKQYQALELKLEFKAKVIDDYLSYASGVIESAAGVQDDVLVYAMLWLLDLRRYHDAMPLVRYVITHGLIMPDDFKRSPATLVTEVMADNELKQANTGKPIDVDSLTALHDFLSDKSLPELATDMPNKVRARLYLAIGKHHLVSAKSGDTDAAKLAVDALSIALALDDKVGGKSDLASAKKIYSQQPSDTTSDDMPDMPDDDMAG